MPTAHVFIATSLDGFIARNNGDIAWLLERDDPTEDHGYPKFIENMDAIVMGRGTFETIRDTDPWPYTLPVIVLSTTLANQPVPTHLADHVRYSAASPDALMAELHAAGVRRVYVDGGQVVQSFLRLGLIDDMVITSIPVLLGAGRSLFGPIEHDISLSHESTTTFPSGLVQSHYRIIK